MNVDIVPSVFLLDYTQPAAQAAKLVIAQVNKNMPYTYGNGIHLKDIVFYCRER